MKSLCIIAAIPCPRVVTWALDFVVGLVMHTETTMG